ncbi:MAG: inorganic triphosphatase [Alphaproteobacteria bacterium]
MKLQHADAISDDKEVELKLGISRRAAATPLVKASAVAGPEQRRLASVYYDTPDLELFHDGYFLRVRADGNSAVQALKSRASVVAGLEIRRESEYPLDDHRMKPDLIVDPPPCLRNPDVLAALRPTVKTVFTRTTWMIATEDGGRIELAFDRGHILAGAHRLPLCEIELELKRGPAAVIFDFALALADAVPLRLGDESKAVRGFSAVAAGAPGWSKARKFVHAGSDSTDAVLVRIVGACLEQISLNQACAAAGSDPEGVHQLRVGIRRLRSALSVYANLVAGDETRPSVPSFVGWRLDWGRRAKSMFSSPILLAPSPTLSTPTLGPRRIAVCAVCCDRGAP